MWRREASVSQMCRFWHNLWGICRQTKWDTWIIFCFLHSHKPGKSRTKLVKSFSLIAWITHWLYNAIERATLRRLVPTVAQPNISTPPVDWQVNLTNLQAGCVMSKDENRYFRFFCSDVAKRFGAPYNFSVWEKLIPQVGEVEPFIRHATVALGALQKSIIVMGHDQKSPRNSHSLDPHHMFAVKSYCKALGGMRKAMAQNQGNLTSAFLACILAFCFENLEGHQKAAGSHAIGGSSLFHKWRLEKPHSNSTDIEDLDSVFAELVSVRP